MEDGTEIYMKPDGSGARISNDLYVFPGGLNRDYKYTDENGTERVSCFLVRFHYNAIYSSGDYHCRPAAHLSPLPSNTPGADSVGVTFHA